MLIHSNVMVFITPKLIQIKPHHRNLLATWRNILWQQFLSHVPPMAFTSLWNAVPTLGHLALRQGAVRWTAAYGSFPELAAIVA